NPGSELFLNIVIVALIVLVVLAVTAGVVYIQQAERKIPIEYAQRLVNRSPVGGQTTHLPLKVNAAGVIPVIFAIAFIMAPRSEERRVGEEGTSRRNVDHMIENQRVEIIAARNRGN